MSLSQYMTPAWAALALWDLYFSDATDADSVIEPCCGDGRMLAAIPGRVEASGVEIDPALAEAARERTGRQVTTGDFFDVDLPPASIAFGNPPFKADWMDRMLARLQSVLHPGGRAGFILPVYFLQSPSRILRWNKDWTVQAEFLPRTLWARLMRPICFTIFTRDPIPQLRGLRLYYEADAVSGLADKPRTEMVSGSGKWSQAVLQALKDLGGRARLEDIYSIMQGRRPSSNTWWKEKIRQTLQRGPFRSPERGVWALG